MLKAKNPKSLNGIWYIRLPVLITLMILILVFTILHRRNNNGVNEPSSSSYVLSKQKWGRGFKSSVQFDPTVQFRNGTDLIWQIPEPAKAVLFLAHGCNGKAANFWDRSPTCPHCVGLPEERLIALYALSRNFAVLTISSAGRCWTSGKERLVVKDIIDWWLKKQKLERLPLVALGASSGGYFVSALATDIRFSSIVLMIAEGVFDRIDVTEDYPPTMFVHMPKDEVRKEKLNENIEMLREKWIDVAEIQCKEFPLSPRFFSDRVPGLDVSTSVKLYDLFREKGFIDKNGYMKNDGRATRWRAALLEKKFVLHDKRWYDYIQEEMNLAFAYHEMTSLQSEQMLNWFESHMS